MRPGGRWLEASSAAAFQDSQAMRRSRYTFAIDDFPDTGKILLFNTLTRAQVVVDAEMRSLLDRLPRAEAPAASADSLARLLRLGILCADDADEDSALEQWFQRVHAGDGALRPTVLTTYSCNLACTYCVEEGVKEPVFMDEATVAEVASYLLRRRRELGSNRIALIFYGGEPLLNPDALTGLASRLQQGCHADEVPFSFSIITNGTLLTPGLVMELNTLGLARMKVTIDGDQAAHDRNRPYRGGRGSFATILANLEKVAGLTGVDIGVNLDERNAATVPALFDELERRCLRERIKRISFKPVSPTPADRRRLPGSAEIPCAWADVSFARWMVELRELAASRGFAVDEGIGAHLCDMIGNPGSFTIDPTGVIYRCSGFVGHPEFASGDIRSGQTGEDPFGELWRRCTSCAMAPLCGDGCPFGSWVLRGDPTALVCSREAMEILVLETIKSSYRRKHRTKPA
jgi:uncharacterized protein